MGLCKLSVRILFAIVLITFSVSELMSFAVRWPAFYIEFKMTLKFYEWNGSSKIYRVKMIIWMIYYNGADRTGHATKIMGDIFHIVFNILFGITLLIGEN